MENVNNQPVLSFTYQLLTREMIAGEWVAAMMQEQIASAMRSEVSETIEA